MTRLMIESTLLVVLALIVGVSHSAPGEYSEHLGTLERLFGDGKKITKLYSGKKQPEAGLSQILALPGLSITAVDGAKVKPKTGYWLFGHSAYNQLPGTYKFRVTSLKRRKTAGWPNKHELGVSPSKPLEKHVTYEHKVVLEAGQKYIMSPIWNDGEMGIISPSQVCLQGPSDNARYCALRPREGDDVFAMDEKHGVIVVGQTGFNAARVLIVNLGCDFYGFGFGSLPPTANNSKSATKLSDICVLGIEPTDSEGYTIESIDAGVWMWWGTIGPGIARVIDTITFEVEPAKVNYVGHYRQSYKNGKLMGLEVADQFSSLESTILAGFGNSEIVNQAANYSGFADAETEKEVTDY